MSFGFRKEGPTDEPHSFTKSVCTKQLTQLPCLVVIARFQCFVQHKPVFLPIRENPDTNGDPGRSI